MTNLYISCAHSDWDARELANLIKHKFEESSLMVISSSSALWEGDAEGLITSQINKCDIFLCYANDKNPYVMFELGYAIGVNKKVILIGDANSIPAGLRNTLYIKRSASPFEIVEQLMRYVKLDNFPRHLIRDLSGTPSKVIHSLIDKPAWLDSIEAKEFEELITNWFTENGFQVETNLKGRDKGYDFSILSAGGVRTLVEVKKYKQSSQVPVSTIRQMVGSMTIENSEFGIIVSSAPFTQAAKYFASEMGQSILLLSLEELDKIGSGGKKEIERMFAHLK